MRDFNREEMKASRPTVDARTAIEHCLEQLFADQDHYTDNEVVEALTFEELIGALLLGLDAVDGAHSG